MPKKKTDKKILPLEAAFKDILVCEKSDWRPYIETFIQEPENITEANLGTLAAIFEITDQSEDSSYIVNYLVSVIKKEYYAHAKRGAVESLEAALHKANLALAKLAEHGNIGWIGHLNALILVIEKRNVHLSQVGSARAFLLRGKTLADITEGAQVSDNPNPLKTFVDVLSGRLEKNDRLIITTDGIFDIFSPEEIKRSAIKFSPEEFARFLHTALVNELDRAAVLMVDLAEKEELTAPEPALRTKKLNAFSQQAFSKAAPEPARHDSTRPTGSKRAKVKAAPEPIINGEEKQGLVAEIHDEIERNSGEFVDKKTGHIYIKEDQFPYEETSKMSELMENISFKTSDLGSKAARSLGGLGKKLRGISWTGIFWEEENAEENLPASKPEQPRRFENEFSQKPEEDVPTKNISAEEAAAILSEARAAGQAPREASRYKKYLKTAQAKTAPLASNAAAKFGKAGGTAFQYLKTAGTALTKFAELSSRKASPLLKEKLARLKPKERKDLEVSDAPRPKENTARTEGGRLAPDQEVPSNRSGITSLFKKTIGRRKPDAVFRSGENIAKKLGGQKLSELKSNNASGQETRIQPPSPAPEPARFDVSPSDRPKPARTASVEPDEPKPNHSAIIDLSGEQNFPAKKTVATTPLSTLPEKSAEGPSNFVDAGRIGDLFTRPEKDDPPPSQHNPSAATSIRIRSDAQNKDKAREQKAAAGNALPSFSKMKNSASRFDYSQKLYAVLAVIILLVVPYFIVRWENGRSKADNATVQDSPATQAQTQNMTAPDQAGNADVPALATVYSGTAIARLVNLNGQIFAVSPSRLVNVQNKTAYPFPADFGAPKTSLGMDELNLIFFINAQNRIISWSPVSQKFQPETLDLPPNAVVSDAKTYLTYLYVLDQENNQIYRYPRTADGFTDKIDWLKAGANLSRVDSMAINGNVFLADANGGLTEYFDGEKQPFQVGAATPAIKVTRVYAKDGDKYIYVLDQINGRIVKLDPNGNVVSQYSNAAFKKALDFAADEADGKIYVTDGTRVSDFKMN